SVTVPINVASWANASAGSTNIAPARRHLSLCTLINSLQRSRIRNALTRSCRATQRRSRLLLGCERPCYTKAAGSETTRTSRWWVKFGRSVKMDRFQIDHCRHTGRIGISRLAQAAADDTAQGGSAPKVVAFYASQGDAAAAALKTVTNDSTPV